MLLGRRTTYNAILYCYFPSHECKSGWAKTGLFSLREIDDEAKCFENTKSNGQFLMQLTSPSRWGLEKD